MAQPDRADPNWMRQPADTLADRLDVLTARDAPVTTGAVLAVLAEWHADVLGTHTTIGRTRERRGRLRAV